MQITVRDSQRKVKGTFKKSVEKKRKVGVIKVTVPAHGVHCPNCSGRIDHDNPATAAGECPHCLTRIDHRRFS